MLRQNRSEHRTQPLHAASPLDKAQFAARQPAEDTLLDLYSRYFDLVPADTIELKREAFRLRYQVYCVENAFENPADHPDGLETDEFDDRSVHSLLVYRPTGALTGTVRLILPQPDTQGIDLPIGRICGEELIADLGLPASRTAEISRFAVSKAFRRRVSDVTVVDNGFQGFGRTSPRQGAAEGRVLPHITLGLMKAVVKMSVENGITHLVAVMEPALLRLLGRIGIKFRNIGPLVHYHGLRQPCYAELDPLLEGILFERPDALEVITDHSRYWRPRLVEA
ncbi:MAG TPA: PEP-CTERM/exosortase system-associated acyltransferase [Alphaproteobacteria bacterium]|nr:PEP-CTERM/exosortase system-associated acyltransferase [Alphaproteobacteria bacterium]